MNKYNKLVNKILIIAFLIFYSLSTLTISAADKYKPDWESIRSRYRVPEWFLDAKFGIFIHWGPYCVPAYISEKYPTGMYRTKWKKIKSREYHIKHYGKDFGYKDFSPMFKAEKFNADAWMDLFVQSGAKYVVPVAEHHDGFAMYDSKVTRWDSVAMGPKRDILGELISAGKRRNMKMGASTHFANNWRYYGKKDTSFDTADPEYADLYSPRKDGWPIFLGNQSRNGFIKSDIKSKLKIKWEQYVGDDLTALSYSQGRLFVSSKKNNTLYCVDGETGKKIWEFIAGGCIDSPPTIYGNKLFFGCRDGSVYSLKSSNGELAWQFKILPTKFIISDNKIESVWPVHGSVLILENTVYFAAGISSFLDEGIKLYGIKADTGELKYKNTVYSWSSLIKKVTCVFGS